MNFFDQLDQWGQKKVPFVFFIDFEGHAQDEIIARVISEIDSDALEVKMLGSYPRAIARS